MSDLLPSDKVVCITTFGDSPLTRRFNRLPVKGRVYCVSGVCEAENADGEEVMSIELVGITCKPDKDGDTLSFNQRCFRRIIPTSERSKA